MAWKKANGNLHCPNQAITIADDFLWIIIKLKLIFQYLMAGDTHVLSSLILFLKAATKFENILCSKY